MIAKRQRKVDPLDLRPSATERHAGKFFLEACLLAWIGRASETICEFEETFSLLLLRIQPRLDEIDDDSARARPGRVRERFHSARDSGRKADGLTDWFGRSRHNVRLHHSAPHCTTTPLIARPSEP